MMIRLLHLSDVHFGRDRADLAANLLGCVAEIKPDVTVLSGDLTQRARPAQFRAAMALLGALPNPQLVVPGNHDIPLDRPLERLFAPWKAYTDHVGADRSPTLDLPGVRLVGINTAVPWFRERGALGGGNLQHACERLLASPSGALRVVVQHHPLLHPPGNRKPAMRGGAHAAQTLVRHGADLVLSGHLHTWGATADLLRTPERAAIAVACGTSLSTRVRDDGNDFAVVDLHPLALPRRIAITRWRAGVGQNVFAPEPTVGFVETAQGWKPVAADADQVVPILLDPNA